jgi:hypothetical protein
MNADERGFEDAKALVFQSAFIGVYQRLTLSFVVGLRLSWIDSSQISTTTVPLTNDDSG